MKRHDFRGAIAFAGSLLLCSPVLAQAQEHRHLTTETHAAMQSDTVSGVVVSTNRDLNYVTVREDITGREIKIDVRGMDTDHSINVWKLRPGDRVTVNGGWEKGDTYRGSRVGFTSFASAQTAMSGRYSVAGIVDGVNRKLNYLTLRDQATGHKVKVDVRRMDTRESVNVWDLRAGDPIVANGMWKDGGLFEATRVNASSFQPMMSAAPSSNFVTATVQSINRNLNYVTVRDDVSGRTMKIDVRKMDTRRSVNVWKLRPGDRIVVDGTMQNDDTFQADTVNF